MDIAFYHITRGTIDPVLPRLIERGLEAGMRVALRVPDGAERARLDRWLWEYQPASFLPHGTEDGADPADQPVLLVAGDHAANGAAMLLVLGPPLPRAGFARAALLFADPDAEAARAEWKTLKAEGLPLAYWKQGAQGWEKAA